MTTIIDVAKEAGVSPATVSRVLTDRPYPMRPETRQRVLGAIDRLGFRPNDVARALLLKRTGTVGLVVPDTANPYYTAISRGVEDVAAASSYTVVFCNTDRDAAKSERYIRTLLQKQVDGLIFAGGGTDFSGAGTTLASFRVPVVFIGRPPCPWTSVQIDNVTAAAGVTGYLAELGHERIGFIGGPERLESARDRRSGYQQALLARGLVVEPKWTLEGGYNEDDGYGAARALLKQRRRPTAIFAANDRMAIGALAAASDLSLRVPHDVSVAGFDDISLASYVRPSLTSVSVPTYQVGDAAMRELLGLIETAEEADSDTRVDGAPAARLLPTRLVVRGSTAPPGKRRPRTAAVDQTAKEEAHVGGSRST